MDIGSFMIFQRQRQVQARHDFAETDAQELDNSTEDLAVAMESNSTKDGNND